MPAEAIIYMITYEGQWGWQRKVSHLTHGLHIPQVKPYH